MRLIVLALVIATPAAAQQVPACAPRDGVVKMLAGKYHEEQRGLGIERSGRLVELFANPDTGTWTVLVTEPGEMPCIAFVGRSWIDDLPLVELDEES